MSNQYATTVYLSVVNGDDSEFDVEIHYTVEKGYLPSYMDPGAPDEVYVEKIVETKTGKGIGQFFANLIWSVELERNILAQYREGLEGARADYMRDLRQDREMSGGRAA
jgi:hypothetical protein